MTSPSFPTLYTLHLNLRELRPADLGFPLNSIGPLKDIPPSDERIWDAMHTWADSLASRARWTMPAIDRSCLIARMTPGPSGTWPRFRLTRPLPQGV